jgi:hypothetical protein
MKEKEATDLKAKLLVEQKSAAHVRSKLANQDRNRSSRTREGSS